MLTSNVDLKSYTDTAYHNEELKSPTRYRFDKVREQARLKQSIGPVTTAKSLELRHTIALIRELDTENEGIEAEIQAVMETIQSPITAIPGISLHMGTTILAEIGNSSRFDSPDKILAHVGLSPSIYQSG